MTVVEMILSTMKTGETVTHYKKGNSNFFLRTLEDGVYLLDKVTKGCSCGVCCGNEEKINQYIRENKLKVAEILHK